MNKLAIDAESRGKVAFNLGICKTHADAEKYARKMYSVVLFQDCFVAGWNMAFWKNNQNNC